MRKIKQEKKMRKVKRGEKAILEKKTGRKGVGREREKKGKKFLLISKIQGNRTIGFCHSKRKNRSTHRELHVSPKILEFR